MDDIAIRNMNKRMVNYIRQMQASLPPSGMGAKERAQWDRIAKAYGDEPHYILPCGRRVPVSSWAKERKGRE